MPIINEGQHLTRTYGFGRIPGPQTHPFDNSATPPHAAPRCATLWGLQCRAGVDTEEGCRVVASPSPTTLPGNTVEALSRVLALLRKRPAAPERAHDEASSAKKAKLEDAAPPREEAAGRCEPAAEPEVAADPADHTAAPQDAGDKELRASAPHAAAASADDDDDPPSSIDAEAAEEAGGADDPDRGVSLLECPVCVDTMQPPVRQCVNGHCVCNACRGRVTSCPLCRGPLSFRTHAALDELARTLTLPCVHRARGCASRVKARQITVMIDSAMGLTQCCRKSRKISLEDTCVWQTGISECLLGKLSTHESNRCLVTDREVHLMECAFNLAPCPLQPCAWSGAFQKARSHCLENHPAGRARVVDLNAKVSFSLEVPVDDEAVKSSLRFEDVGLFVGAEAFVLEVHADELPGRVAVLVRQLSAGRAHPPAHCCVLALRCSSRPQAVLSARVPVLAQNETLVPAVDAGRCLVAAEEAVRRLCAGGAGGAGGGLALECTISLPPGPAAPGWLSWLAGKVWPRPEYH
ncbi:E3 ubiquitin-protein ligase sina [Frankliniella fusca]|uniref:E3 ubiquitin-protein ligase sina n=1 Tax=Frankliniella fusca TaxID=407009 RepID=A0AAE1HKN8_9NEOP|nr:E3 ubiquitin-protein ligase sina [Frankliniella fusca]